MSSCNKSRCATCRKKFTTHEELKAHMLSSHPDHETRLIINGAGISMPIEPNMTLAELLREKLLLTGTKVGCDTGACGACTVIADGRPILSCMTLAVECDGMSIETIEGLTTSPLDDLHPIQEAFIKYDALQCGACTPGFIMDAKGLLEKKPNPTEEEVKEALSSHLCVCGTFPKVIEAVLAAGKVMREEKEAAING